MLDTRYTLFYHMRKNEVVGETPKPNRHMMEFQYLCTTLTPVFHHNRDLIRFELNPVVGKLASKVLKQPMTLEEFLKKDWSDNEKVQNHKVLRVAANIDKYNRAFLLSNNNKYLYTEAPPPTITSMTEEEVARSVCDYNIPALYLEGVVSLPHKWGMESMISFQRYVMTQDRYYLNDEKNGPITILSPVPCRNHPPLVTDTPSPTPIIKRKNWEYFPTPPHSMISTWKGPLDTTKHHVHSITRDNIPPDSVILTTHGASCDWAPSRRIDGLLVPISKKYKNIVILFKNNIKK